MHATAIPGRFKWISSRGMWGFIILLKPVGLTMLLSPEECRYAVVVKAVADCLSGCVMGKLSDAAVGPKASAYCLLASEVDIGEMVSWAVEGVDALRVSCHVSLGCKMQAVGCGYADVQFSYSECAGLAGPVLNQNPHPEVHVESGCQVTMPPIDAYGKSGQLPCSVAEEALPQPSHSRPQ
ncbi:hypothetical protein Nepgr_014753 [Nepenthes gracilis]|uniref:Uncharacterized protein n=1 Tax=Nepenthes gracilis TaxID=150966 RepID=A0AAD3XPT0_NEPGR|nr:hypothetical protein Nepgr_014753 [Nepenthes gracilis]